MSPTEEHLADLARRHERVWPDHVPREPTYPFGEISFADHLRRWAADDPERIAVVFYGREYSYGLLDDLSDRFVAWLESVGVAAGDRVGVLLPNCPQFYVAMLGILKLGAVHVPVNTMFREHELRYQLDDAAVEVLVAIDALAPLIDAVRDGSSLREVLYTSIADALPEVPTLALPEAWTAAAVGDLPRSEWHRVASMPRAGARSQDLDAVAALNYTGGTTGLPKGCIHTQRHMVYTAVTGSAASAGGENFGRGGDVLLVFIPLFWIAGEDFGILTPIVFGGTVVLLGRWDARTALDAIDRYGVTGMLAKVESYSEMIEHPDFARRDLSTLRHPRTMSIVQKSSPEARRRWMEAVGEHSLLREGSYGLTESHTADTVIAGFDHDDRDLGSQPVFVGLPTPGTQFAVVGFDDGLPVPVGGEGEIVLRSPSMMTGYWGKPEATAEAIRDGWFHTGDVGMIDDDGCLHYLARRKEMIKVNGMSVFPAELEQILGRHPDIAAVAVVPADDPRTGQAPVAFVELVRGGAATADELVAWSRENLAVYKVPSFRPIPAMPMTGTGKVDKGELLARVEESS